MDVVQRFFIKGEADAGQAKSELKGLQTSMDATGNAAGQFNLKLLNIDAAMGIASKAIQIGERALRAYFGATEEGRQYMSRLEVQAGALFDQLVHAATGADDLKGTFISLSGTMNDMASAVDGLTGKWSSYNDVIQTLRTLQERSGEELKSDFSSTVEAQLEALNIKMQQYRRDAARAYIAQNWSFFTTPEDRAQYGEDVGAFLEDTARLEKAITEVFNKQTYMAAALKLSVETLTVPTRELEPTFEKLIDAASEAYAKLAEQYFNATYGAIETADATNGAAVAAGVLSSAIDLTGKTSERASAPVRQLTEDFRALDNAMKAAMGGVGAGLEHGGDLAGILGAIDRARGEQQVRAQITPGMFAEEDAMTLGALIAGTAEQIPDHADMAIESLNGMQSAALSMGETMAQAFGMAATSAEDFSVIAGNAMLKGIGTMATTMGHFFILAGLGQSVPGLTWNPGAGALIGIGTAMEIFGAAIGGVSVGGGGGGVSAGTRSAGAAGINRGPSQSIQLDSQTVVMLDGEVIARSVQRQHSLGGVGRNG